MGAENLNFCGNQKPRAKYFNSITNNFETPAHEEALNLAKIDDLAKKCPSVYYEFEEYRITILIIRLWYSNSKNWRL